jgi:hypothetical protein
MKRRDTLTGITLAVLGVLIVREASMLTYRDEFGPGPGLLPFWLGILLTGLALCLVASSWLKNRDSSDTDVAQVTDTTSGQRRRVPAVLVAMLGFLGIIAVLNVLGFILSFGLLSFFLVYVVERRSLKDATIVAFACAASFLLLFRVLIPLPLPAGPWGF